MNQQTQQTCKLKHQGSEHGSVTKLGPTNLGYEAITEPATNAANMR